MKSIRVQWGNLLTFLGILRLIQNARLHDRNSEAIFHMEKMILV